MNEWMSADDKVLLAKEEVAMRQEAYVAPLVNRLLTQLRMRVFVCETCRVVVALAIRPDTEVITDELRRAMTSVSEQLGVPVLDDAEMLPECKSCGGKIS
jgi:hypothetical protein